MWIPLEKYRPACVSDVRELDRRAINEFCVPGVVLMENAGRAVVDAVTDLSNSRCDATRFVVFAGKGNNGGDGCVVARHLHNQGREVHVFLSHAHEEITGDARVNLDIVARMKGLPCRVLSEPGALEQAAALCDTNAVIIDALLGTGLTSNVRAPFDAYIECINGSSADVVAVDIPSGLDADTGEILGCCVAARITVTFALIKKGLLTREGSRMAGKVLLADIGIPRDLYKGFERT